MASNQKLYADAGMNLDELFLETLVEFFVAGEPKAKGSMRSIPFQDKAGKLHVNTFHDTKSGTAWERITKLAALESWGSRPTFKDAVRVDLTFTLKRPKTVSEKKRPQPIVKPDIDKLARSVLDAVTGVVFADDAQVTGLVATKRYGNDTEPTGVTVRILR